MNSNPVPPDSPPWCDQLDQAPLAFVDVETTGLDLKRDRIVEICIDRVVGGKTVGRLETLLDPQERLGRSSAIHGIHAEALMGMPKFPEVAERVIDLLRGAILVAHAARWDVGFLHAELRRCGQDFSIEAHLDTLGLSRAAFSLQSYRLAAIAQSLGIDVTTVHRAAADVGLLRAIFGQIVDKLGAVRPRELWLSQPQKPRVPLELLAMCAQAATNQNCLQIEYRNSRGQRQALQFMVTNVQSNLDPPLVMGYLLPSRARRELRADRIEAIAPRVDPLLLSPTEKT